MAHTFHHNHGFPKGAAAVAVRIDEDRAAMDELGARAQHCEFVDAICYTTQIRTLWPSAMK